MSGSEKDQKYLKLIKVIFSENGSYKLFEANINHEKRPTVICNGLYFCI